MPPRLYIDQPLAGPGPLDLPDDAARHVQVLRLQPGAELTLFDGRGGQWQAEVLAMGRRQVSVRLLAHRPHECELPLAVTLALGMPANERMDTVVEKAAELGVTALVPLTTQRSVLRLAGERAQRKAQHWQAVAVAACEQSGRNRVPAIAPPQALAAWLPDSLRPSAAAPTGTISATTSATTQTGPAPRGAAPRGLLLSLDPDAPPLLTLLPGLQAQGVAQVVLLSGPEGGLAPDEVAAARQQGFQPVGLGPRVLRADTAPLAALAVVAAWCASR